MGRVTGIAALSLVMMTVCAPAHAAERSTGLYAPFPSLTGREYLQRYVADFGVAASSERLQQGQFLGRTLTGPAARKAPLPAARAAPGRGVLGSTLIGVLAGIGLVACVGGLIHWLGRASP